MKLSYWILGICIPLVGLSLWRQGDSLSANASLPKPPAQGALVDVPSFLGAASCSASACHGNRTAHGIVGSEFTWWATRDPHAKAYESLFNDKSLAIQKALNSDIAPHEDRRCLQCHVSPQYELPAHAHFRTEGVSCETCHGPAKSWIKTHHLPDWKRRSATEKLQHGMRDLRSVVDRAKVCMGCHVGSSDIDINHDLIAAGHPRLYFEFSAFHEHLPRHWPDVKDRKVPDFEARAWLVGQLWGAHANLDLLADRASDEKKSWPEYAENDCAACHHDLQTDRLKSLRVPGSLSIGYAAGFTPSALDLFRSPQNRERAVAFKSTLKRLHANIHRSTDVNRVLLAKDAMSAAGMLHPFVEQWGRQPTAPLAWNELFQALLDSVPSNSDEATQRMLGLAALQRSFADRQEPLPTDWRAALAVTAEKMSRPRGFDPQAIQHRWLEFKRLNSRKGP